MFLAALRALMCATLATIPFSASAQTILLIESQADAGYTQIAKYEGEGWRNLRRIWYATSISANTDLHWQYFYFVCGTESALLPWSLNTEGPQDYEVYPNKSSDDDFILQGGTRKLSARSFLFVLSAQEEANLLKATKGTCQKAPTTRIQIDDIDLSISSDQHFRLVPDRFQRKGDRISAWIESIPFDQREGTFGKIEWTYLVVDPTRGRSMSKVEFDCAAYSLATSSFTDYDNLGNVADSASVDAARLVLKEAVPGSVGDAWLETVCLIE